MSNVAPGSFSTGVDARIVGGASGSPDTARLAVSLPISSTAAAPRPGPSSAPAAFDSETTCTLGTRA
ncbi:hypothetical protein C0J29_04770 [Mycobacterium paragordonae]|nr:hypothetical protein C0J29_04770 [Mycobacterium paragordonae]